ncbi:general L-amino acid transport system permease protein [Desulfonatronum thiosulfatophilum]|uniref:General L-amino acid transport system permease protein n=1 Tax=Desulfonatronum thiosulfatophilum TaxID=617002 RepID=A0A1G6BZE5_9BACT|nr:general L-amino acid transport system permease protein [Desulfonatronum thiosulfatophilum]
MYVKTTRHPDLPPPLSEVGVLGWMRKNLFSSWLNSLMTLAAAALLLVTLPPLLNWSLFSANWIGQTRDACLPPQGNPDGACWVFIRVRFDLLMYGFYPIGERWRVDFTLLLLIGLGGPLILSTLLPFRKRINKILLLFLPLGIVGFSLFSYGMFAGLAAAALLMAPEVLGRIFRKKILPPTMAPRLRQTLFIAVPLLVWYLAGQALESIDPGGAGPLALIAGALMFLFFALSGQSTVTWRFYLLFTIYPCVAYILLLGGGVGLPLVETDRWGGMFLTLVIAGIGIAVSLPVGILLALGRRSQMPVIKALCVSFIEFVRGVPLISVLFMVSVMLPLTLPQGVHFDKLLRALIGVSLFYAAYMAEVVRGGLQAIPKGQYEAAEALGLGYWQSMRLVILPQALRLVIPGITNTFLGLLKDTTLVAVINLMDILGILKSALADSNWLGYTKEAYVFAGVAFWILCFSLSRYSQHLEKLLRPGRS